MPLRAIAQGQTLFFGCLGLATSAASGSRGSRLDRAPRGAGRSRGTRRLPGRVPGGLGGGLAAVSGAVPGALRGRGLALAMQVLPRARRGRHRARRHGSRAAGLVGLDSGAGGRTARGARPPRRFAERGRHRLPDAPAHRPRRLEHRPRRIGVLPASPLSRTSRRRRIRDARRRSDPTSAGASLRSPTASSTSTERSRSRPESRRSLRPVTIPAIWRFGSSRRSRRRCCWATSRCTPHCGPSRTGSTSPTRTRPQCADTRRALLPQLVDRDVLVACGHYPGSGIGHLVTRDGRIVWEEAR